MEPLSIAASLWSAQGWPASSYETSTAGPLAWWRDTAWRPPTSRDGVTIDWGGKGDPSDRCLPQRPGSCSASGRYSEPARVREKGVDLFLPANATEVLAGYDSTSFGGTCSSPGRILLGFVDQARVRRRWPTQSSALASPSARPVPGLRSPARYGLGSCRLRSAERRPGVQLNARSAASTRPAARRSL